MTACVTIMARFVVSNAPTSPKSGAPMMNDIFEEKGCVFYVDYVLTSFAIVAVLTVAAIAKFA